MLGESRDMGLIPQGAETFCSPWAILRGSEPVSALTRALLNCCTLYFFSFLDVVVMISH